MCYDRRVFAQNPLSRWLKIPAALLALALGSTALGAPSRATAPRGRVAPPAASRVDPASLQFQALPLERSRQNHLLLRAYINGKPALLGVDTGAPISAISIARARHFGMSPIGEDAEVPSRLRINGRYNDVFVARGLQLGALNLIEQPMVALDLGGSNRAAKLMKEQAIDGIIGADILFPTEAVIDCAAPMLMLKIDPDAKGKMPGVNYRGLTRVPMKLSSGYNLYVDGRVNGRRAQLMVDTGAFTTLLHQGFVRNMKIPLTNTRFSWTGVNVKNSGVQTAMISRLSIGKVHMRSKKVGVIDLEGLIRGGLLDGTDATPPVAGLLGSEILQRHNGIIDFRTKSLYLRK